MNKLAAELLGTFILVFAGTGAIVVNQVTGGAIGHAGIALTFGLVVMALIYALGDISGCHLNPAVTLAFTAAGRFPARDALPYAAAQLTGALAASGLLALLFPLSETAGATLGATLPRGSNLQSLILEAVLTFILMLVILAVSSGPKEKGVMAGIAIGAVVGLEAMFAGPICGASMNPARSIGPAVVSGNHGGLWIYILGPIAGALAAIPAHRLISPQNPPVRAA